MAVEAEVSTQQDRSADVLFAAPRLPVSDWLPAANAIAMRRHNRARVLSMILLNGVTTRARIATQCGLSVAAANNIVAGLMGEGLVRESGLIPSQGGRPITAIAPRADGAFVVGVDVGERGMTVELLDLALTCVDREVHTQEADLNPVQIKGVLDSALVALAERNVPVWERVAGIGLGLPGIVETDEGGTQILYAQSLGWPPVPVRALIDSQLPIIAENGAKTLAKAEHWHGAARGMDDALIVLLGRGVGMGVVAAGAIQHGAASTATEFGHIKIERGGRVCRCGGRGCLEAYLGADQLVAQWRGTGGTDPERAASAGPADIVELFSSSEPAAVRVVDEAVEMLGQALGSVVNMTNPRRIVVGGWVGLPFMAAQAPRIEAAIRENALDRPGSRFTLLSSSFGVDAVATGAGMLATETFVIAGRG